MPTLGRYREARLNSDRDIQGVRHLYGKYITDMTFNEGDYVYSIGFTNSPYLWKSILYTVVVTDNGKALYITLEQYDGGYSKIIYKND